MQLKYPTELSIEFLVPPSKKPVFIGLVIFGLVLVFWSFLSLPVIFLACLFGIPFIFVKTKAWGLLDISSNFIYLRGKRNSRRWEYEGPLHQIREFRIEKVGVGSYDLIIDTTTIDKYRLDATGSLQKLSQLVLELNTFLHMKRPEVQHNVNLPQHILPQKPKGKCKYCWGDVYLTPRYKDILGQYAHQGCQDARDYERAQQDSNGPDCD